MAQFKIKRLISGGLITNYFCTSRCRHCLYNCSPQWEKDYIIPQVAEENLIAVRQRGCSTVHIGGGEPLLRPENLCAVLDVAAAAGVAIDYVETNSSWFRDADSAESMLSQLRKSGLQTLLVSISPFHNEFIPLAKIKGVFDAARKTGINIFPWISDFLGDLSEMDASSTHSLAEFEALFGPDYVKRLPQRYWTHLGGRALKTFRPYFATKSADKILHENAGNCATELTDTGHFHLDLFGNYIPGLCSGLTIKREDLNRPLAPDNYPVLTVLFAEGIRGLFKMAQTEFDYLPARNRYINKCDLCTEIRTVFVQNAFGGPAELNPKQFYLNI